MGTFKIRQGRDIKLLGEARPEIVNVALPSTVALQPADFKGIKAKVVVKPGDAVKVGTAVIVDKHHPEVKIASPVSGKVKSVNRGEKRVLLEVVIETDGRQEAEQFRRYNDQEIQNLTHEVIIQQILQAGLWPVIRQRPFTKIAHPTDKPKSIFVHAMNTDPLAADMDVVLQGKEKEFQAGLEVLRKLTDGKTHLCIKVGAKSTALIDAKNVHVHRFSGPHPAGNVSTHIHHVDPISRGQIVWYVGAQDVIQIGNLFLTGRYVPERTVAVVGEGATDKAHFRTIVGASVASLLKGSKDSMCCISGSVLSGREVSPNGYIHYYDTQLTVIPRGGERKLLGWLAPGFDKYTFSKTFASAFLPEKKSSLDTDRNGSDRAIVLNNIYDHLVPLDIMTYFLLKAVISGDVEEAEKLGILECDEEDFALCTFACPSKTDVGGIIKEGLDLIEKEM